MIDSLSKIERDLEHCRRRLAELAPDDAGRKIFVDAIATFEAELGLVSFASKWAKARRSSACGTFPAKR